VTNGDNVIKAVELFVAHNKEQLKVAERTEKAVKDMQDLLKSTVRTIRVAAALFGVSVLISSAIVFFGTNYMDSRRENKRTTIEENRSVEEEKQLKEEISELKSLVEEHMQQTEKEDSNEK
jgi:C4-dicarboxylate-specific signal transduction histidine kinase